MAYQVRTEKFEGPLEALLSLIEEKKLSISEISLSHVCGEFIAYIKTLSDLPRAEVASFLMLASTLVLIKSRTLIPTFDLSEEEKGSIEELEMRLQRLKEFRRLSKHLQEYAKERNASYSRDAFRGYEFGFLPPTKLNSASLQILIHRVVNTFPLKDLLPEKILAQVISIEEKTRDLINRIHDRLSGSLESIIMGKDKTELIVGFLAILELIKQGFLEVEQRNIFGEVELKKIT